MDPHLPAVGRRRHRDRRAVLDQLHGAKRHHDREDDQDAAAKQHASERQSRSAVDGGAAADGPGLAVGWSFGDVLVPNASVISRKDSSSVPSSIASSGLMRGRASKIGTTVVRANSSSPIRYRGSIAYSRSSSSLTHSSAVGR